MKDTGFVFQLFRLYLLPWAAGAIAWFASFWVLGLIITPILEGGSYAAGEVAAWVGALLSPTLTATVAVLVLPRPALIFRAHRNRQLRAEPNESTVTTPTYP